MAITVGRAGGDAALPLPSPTTVERSDNGVRLRGNLWSETSIALARVLREQVLGLDPKLSPGMPARPVIYSGGDIARLGRVLSASCPSSKAAEANGVWPYDIDIEWVTSSQAPMLEERLIGALRTQPDGSANAASIASNTSIAIHSPGVGVAHYSPVAASNLFRSGADGQVYVAYGGTNRYYAASSVWSVAPADFYKGAVQIVQTVSGSPLINPAYSVVGREMRAVPEGWGIFNSLVAVVGSATAGFAEFHVLFHDGSAYESSKTFRITLDSSWGEGASSDLGPELVRARMVSPEQCVLRVYFGTSASPTGGCYVDFSIRRGSRFVSCQLTGRASLAYGVSLQTGEALTAITGGARATNSDASGNKLILASPQTHTLDTTNGRIRLTSAATRFHFGIGAAIGGTVGTAIDETQGVAYEYFADQSSTQRSVIP